MSLKCHLREIPKNSMSPVETFARKHGRYLKSMFGIEGYGHTSWVVGCYVDIDYHNYIQEMAEEEFINRCISYLNTPPERQKFQRTPHKSLYGNLKLHSYRLRETNGKCFIELELITDEQKNENFWGEGLQFDQRRKKRSSKNRRVSQREQYPA